MSKCTSEETNTMDSANEKYHCAVSSLEDRYRRILSEEIDKCTNKDNWGCSNPKNTGCSCSCSFMLVFLFGMTAGACMSWMFNHSVLWMIIHAFFGWLYVCYKALWYVVTNF